VSSLPETLAPTARRIQEEDERNARGGRSAGVAMAMRTQCTLSDLAVISPLMQGPLEKRELARRALDLAEGPCFDERVALATVDKLVGFGLLRKVRARYEVTQDGRDALAMALQDLRESLDRMSRLISPRMLAAPPRPLGGHAAA